MTSTEWIQLATSLAWPIVGLVALVYVWRSDAVGKLIKISEAVKDLRERLKELVEAEERLSTSIGAISEVTTTINDLQSEFLAMKADVEAIRDKVDQRLEVITREPSLSKIGQKKLDTLFADIDKAWRELESAMKERFGWFDGRKTGSEAYRFAHGNRKGLRLSHEQADEIAGLHSTIKSYRRRQASLADWLTQEVRDDFVRACSVLAEKISELPPP